MNTLRSIGVMNDLVADGNSVALVEHDTQILRSANYINEMGPGGGESGGRIVVTGTPEEIRANKESITGKYL